MEVKPLTLYQRHNYLNKDVQYLISNEIIEYDIQSAGFNIMKKYKLLDDAKIRYLETLEKKQRQIQIGLYQRQDRNLVKALNDKFVEVRKWFFENNNISDDDVLSIKKDAIYVTKRCNETEFDNIIFAEKNVYTSYYFFNRYEFYYNKDTMDVKGISDDLLELHHDYMLNVLYNIFRMNEVSSRKKVIQLITEFAQYYKSRQLDVGFYRELNYQSLYRLYSTVQGQVMGISDIADKKQLDIGYNYMNYIVPMITILV